MKKTVVAGIDIGGTKIALALEDADKNPIADRRIATQVELGPDRITANILATLDEMLRESGTEPCAIGIGCPGPIDIERGLVLSPSNLPGWVEFPLVEMIRQRFDVPVTLDNDANAAALGEFRFGAGRGFSDLLYVTISTGIGGAIIGEGRLHHGVEAGAGEIGHTIVVADGEKCRCGAVGCLETIASGTGIARRMREALARENGGDPQAFAEITAETVVDRLRLGDPLAERIWAETVRYLAIGIGNAVTLIAPQAVIIGGGVSAAGELLLAPLRQAICRNVTMLPIEKVKVLQASLGSDSGVRGALVLARGEVSRRIGVGSK